jgi:hypothetical protein
MEEVWVNLPCCLEIIMIRQSFVYHTRCGRFYRFYWKVSAILLNEPWFEALLRITLTWSQRFSILYYLMSGSLRIRLPTRIARAARLFDSLEIESDLVSSFPLSFGIVWSISKIILGTGILLNLALFLLNMNLYSILGFYHTWNHWIQALIASSLMYPFIHLPPKTSTLPTKPIQSRIDWPIWVDAERSEAMYRCYERCYWKEWSDRRYSLVLSSPMLSSSLP